MKNYKRLTEKNALVTEVSTDIGKGIAVCFSQEGGHFVINDINTPHEAKTASGIVLSGEET